MKLVILSRNASLYSTNSLVKAARRRGHQVKVLDHMNCDLHIDTKNPQIKYEGHIIQHVDAIIPRIGTSATTYGTAVIRQFQNLGAFTTLEADALLKARDKLSCLQILSQNGIGVPRSLVSNNYFSIESMVKDVGSMPAIIKLINGTHGLGVILTETKSNAESILEAFYKAKQKVMIQEFIKEARGADIRVFVVNDEIVGVMKRQAGPGEFRSNLHRGATSSIVKISSEEQKVALKAARILGLKVAGVDMLLSDRGPLILEVNASPGLEGIENATKRDIAGSIISFVEKNYRS